MCAPRWFSPVGLPDVDCLWVIDAVFFRHVVQEVEEESHSDGRRTLCAEDGHKHIIYKLLQRPLEEDGQVQGQRHRMLPANSACWSRAQHVTFMDSSRVR